MHDPHLYLTYFHDNTYTVYKNYKKPILLIFNFR